MQKHLSYSCYRSPTLPFLSPSHVKCGPVEQSRAYKVPFMLEEVEGEVTMDLELTQRCFRTGFVITKGRTNDGGG